MGFFDNIAEKAQEFALSVSDTYENVSKTVKEKTVGELIDAGIKSTSEAFDNASEVVSSKAKELKEDAANLTMEDVGNYAKKMGKLASGMTAYEQRKSANEKKEKADKIVEETTKKIPGK